MESETKPDQHREQRIQRFLDELEQAGKRQTLQRHAICRALVETEPHPTVAEIYHRVTRSFPMISQATVYNTIDTLRELGLIIQLDIANHDHTHFDVDTSPHVNVVCRYCGEITDVHDDSVDALLAGVSRKCGYTLLPEAGLILYGVCPQCLNPVTRCHKSPI
jgi:Fur family transcriptional regulator, peroxide stress response regulator